MDPDTLFVRARNGDREAWDGLLAWLRPVLRALFRRQLRCPDEASDLTNDVLLRMHRGFGRFRGETLAQLRVWARQIAANALCGHVSGREAFVPLSFDPPCHRQPEGPPELGDRLARALARLPESQRRVVEARLFDGLSPARIAESFGWPAGRVRVYFLRAIESLSRQLRGQP